MHHHHPANTLTLTFGRIEKIITLSHLTGINTDKSQRAHKRVIHNLEGETGKRFSVVGTALNITSFFFVTWLKANISRHIKWARQEVNHSVQHRLNPFVLKGRST